jgi:hypothetical protein
MIAATALALAAAAQATACDWTDRGHDPYRGTMTAAVERYADIPAPTRRALAARMEQQRYDQVVAIRRDGVDGYADMRDMHWGAGRICRGPVVKTRWTASDEEIGLVYCEAGHCLIVPTVCRNVSRITPLPPSRALLDAPGGLADAVAQIDVGPPAMLPVPGIVVQPPAEVAFDAPGAGRAAARSLDLPGWPGNGGVATIPGTLATIGAGLVTIGAAPAGLPAVVEPIPEPATWALFAVGIALVALAAWIGRARP